MDKLPVSVIIITKNEGRSIERCVRSVSACEQIVVVDSHSDDDTQAIATAAGAEIVPFTWDGQYPKKKQWSLEHGNLRHDWVLYLDGDEYATPALMDEIRRLLPSPSCAAYDVPLDYVFLGTPLEHGYKVHKRIFFDRHRCGWEPLDDLSVENPIELELHVQPVVNGETGLLESRVVHHDLEPLGHYFARHNRYSDWEAVLRQDKSNVDGVNRTARGKVWAKVPFKPAAFFTYSYVAKQGFRDGRAGFHYAVANSFYYWQIGIKARHLRESPEEYR